MVQRRYVLTLASLFICTLVLFHFQNCAPAGKISSGEIAGGVRIVDDYSKTQLQFVSAETVVQDQALKVDVMGLCTRNHNGAQLRWAVWEKEQSGRPLFTGESFCHSGQFEFNVSDLGQMVCGVNHTIVIAGDWGGSSMAYFSRRCQPLASRLVDVPDDIPLGTTCALEFNPGNESIEACATVCYRADKVVSAHTELDSTCSALKSSLAGQ